SEYLWVIHQMERGIPPYLDMDKEAGLNRSVLDAVNMGIIKSAHDISEGGLGIALAEGCISGNRPAIGASISLGEHGGLRPDILLFSESQSRAIVTVRKGHLDDLMRIAETNGIVATRIGVVGGESLRIELPARGTIIDIKVDAMREAWREAIGIYVR
ncbi:MAG TPA: AIR synthase-related protein, partial [Nitrospiria bacterium]|nr:AIR synthase-related protein [Nitrospiria bacterium]